MKKLISLMLLLMAATSVAFASVQGNDALSNSNSSQSESANSQSKDTITKSTYTYAVKSPGDTLRLDYYTLAEETAQPRPAFIFAFGGSFKTGDRAAKSYITCFEFLAREGYAVFSIDYRTGLSRPEIAGNISSVETFVGALTQAIDMAVEDLFDATAYVIANAEMFGVDPQQIVASGSSAGAITALQSEYYIANGYEATEVLPENFNYAGVVSFAGAVLSPIAPQWASTPCPIMLFHGDADPTVPFDKVAVDGFGGLYGSQSIANSLRDIDASYCFCIVENANHSVAVTPMKANLFTIMQFLTTQVAARKPLQTTITERVPGSTPAKKDFTLPEYLQNNM